MFSSPKVSPGWEGQRLARGQVPRVPGKAETLSSQGRGIQRHQEHPKACRTSGRNPKESGTKTWVNTEKQGRARSWRRSRPGKGR